jgi:hypothetical protein
MKKPPKHSVGISKTRVADAAKARVGKEKPLRNKAMGVDATGRVKAAKGRLPASATVTHARTRPKIAATPPPMEGVVVPRLKRVRLKTVADWKRQIARIYRAMYRGEPLNADGTKLVWVADIGVKVTKYLEEMQQFAERTRVLEAILAEREVRGLPALPAIEHDHDPATVIEPDAIEHEAEEPAP